ncbi:hypothetical protein Tsubulata_018950 [Turnera subulata]|uniref:glucan endo-1,3-beta-D-glucosidase n=1 Tax=Turnera subulata TaxID=218843 RepID=A0A9Q0FAT2_9ROSI|nr:hypothetical protein Tsubulata_018950 [Turnera subulata]
MGRRAGLPESWCSCLIVVAAVWAATNVNVAPAGASVLPTIGVNYGMQASHPLNPDIVVKMFKDNGIKKVKLFDADSWTVGAFAGTGIEVMVGIPNNQLEGLAKDYSRAEDWVKENVTKQMYKGGVDIKYVAVGNEAFLTSYKGKFDKLTLPAMQNVKKALDKAGFGGKIKVTTPLNADVYESKNNKPSEGDFREDIKGIMKPLLKFLRDNKSPFVVNVYPFLSLYQIKGFPTDYAFFDSNHGKSIQDNNINYKNVFDANVDTLVWALKKNGASDLKITIGEVGWPTDGDFFANPTLARRFYSGLLKKLASNEGTPLRPGPMVVYLFGMVDEDMKSIDPGKFERHWGIFRYDGKPKFPMDLSGNGNEKMLVGAKGVQYLPKQWCALKEDAPIAGNTADAQGYACLMGDCTSLVYGGSCNNLDQRDNVSYAFNMYFQMADQDVAACNFNGLGEIVKTNLSQGNCLFPIYIDSAADQRLPFGFGAAILAALVLPILMLS